jgi:dipeptidyl aminopeptidase/acylaminoacyl peptidase
MERPVAWRLFAMRSFASALALLVTFIAVPAAAQPSPPAAAPPRTPLTADLMWQIKRLGSPAISPDGQWAVVGVTSWNVKEDRPSTDLWLVRTDGTSSRQITSHEGSESGPAWSPDGKWIAFEARRGDDETAQLYLLPLEGGEARRLTNIPTGASAVKWFADSQRLAFISRVWRDLDGWDAQGRRLKERRDSKMTARTWDKAPIRYWDRWLDDREAHVFTIGLEGGDPKPVTLDTGLQLSKAEPGPGSYDVSPDGTEIAFAADVDTTGVAPNFDIHVVPVAGGPARNLTRDNPADDGEPIYSSDGKVLAFTRQTIRDFYADRLRLVFHDRAAGTTRIVTEAWDRSVGGLVWVPDGTALLGAIDDAGQSKVYRIDAASGKPTALTTAQSVRAIALSRDGRTAVAVRDGFSEPPTLVRLDLGGGAPAKISTFNDALLARVEWGRYESVTYKGSGGASIQMWVVYPPGFDPSKKYPVYLLLHGGPHNGVQDAFTFRWNAQVFAGWGYVTAWHNFHGSSGFGQAFTDAITEDWATKPYEDTIAAASWLAAQPWADTERMAAGGGSYGGYLATLLLGRPHPFKTLVAHAAVYNLYTQYGSDGGAERKRFGEFWEPRQDALLRRMSPHLGAANFTTPTLVIHGALDYRVPDNHGLEVFNALQNRGVRSRLIHYPNENHWILKPQNSLYWYQAKQEWLREFIGSGVRPAPAAAGPVQFTTPLGRAAYAQPDAAGAIAKADAALAADPRNVDLIVAAGRARDAAWRYGEAIDVYTRGLATAPDDVRLLRFRGHRYISTRKLDLALADLERAATLAPSSFDVLYHLGLAHYLSGRFQQAAAAYRACLDATSDPKPLPAGWRSCTAARTNDGDRVALSDWLYRSLRRAGKHAEARTLLATIGGGLGTGDNEAYYAALRFYQGVTSEAQALEGASEQDNRLATLGYAVANFHLVNGNTGRACALLRRVVDTPTWNAFGYLAAEAELQRGTCGKSW